MPSMLFAACTGSSPTWSAASANRDDVAACIAASTYGDTINIPSCAAGDCVWTSGITITKDIKIKGAGMDSTYITSGLPEWTGGEYHRLILFSPDATSRSNLDSLNEDTNTFEISGITFTTSTPQSGVYTLQFYSGSLPVTRRIKIYNNRFVNWSLSLYSYGHIYGVVYNNEFVDARGPKVAGNGYSTFTDDRMLPGDGKGWYIEDNIFTRTGTDSYIASNGNDGGGWVARYNTVTGTMSSKSGFFETHGNQGAGIYGPQKTEVYCNNITATGVGNAGTVRGGKAIYFNNVFASGSLGLYEEYSDLYTRGSYDRPLNRCEENQGVLRQTCTDSCICQKPHDDYFWNNRPSLSGTNMTASICSSSICGNVYDCENQAMGIANSPRELEEDIEYFNYVGTIFDGTKGVGCGTIEKMNVITPTTTGVGFWVPTDIDTMPCSSISPNNIGNNPSVPITGTLYKWNGSAWVAFWAPYTYPHPLRRLGNQLSGGVVVGGTF